MSDNLSVAGRLDTVGLDKLIGFSQEFALKEIGRDVQTLVTEHLQRFDRDHPNKLGGKRTHFYGSMAESVTLESDATEARVTIHDVAINQAIFGGRIQARNVKYLTIPAIAEAHGMTAREWDSTHPSLVPVFSRTGGLHVAALAEARSTPVGKGAPRRTKKGEVRQKAESRTGGRVVFWLTRSVDQNPTPNVVPGDAEVLPTIERALEGLTLQANRITV